MYLFTSLLLWKAKFLLKAVQLFLKAFTETFVLKAIYEHEDYILIISPILIR